jgi:large subunit ribosomal protein L9
MPYNEVLLLKPVEGLGGEGDQVRVRAGYARNYLFPQKIGVPLTQSNRKQIEALKRRRSEREADEVAGAKALAQKIENVGSLAFAVKTGEGGRMFGAITAADIHEKLEAAGIAIDRKKILLFTPAKALGRHTVKVKIHADVSAEVAFDIVSENPIVAPVVEDKEKKPAPRRSEAKK